MPRSQGPETSSYHCDFIPIHCLFATMLLLRPESTANYAKSQIQPRSECLDPALHPRGISRTGKIDRLARSVRRPFFQRLVKAKTEVLQVIRHSFCVRIPFTKQNLSDHLVQKSLMIVFVGKKNRQPSCCRR